MTKSGAFFGNEQQARMRDALPKPAPIRADDDKAEDGPQQEITLSKTPDGFHFSEPGGEEGDVASFDELMDKAKECLGVEPEPEDQGAPAPSEGDAPPTRY
jgi:hypothetical protein